MVSLVSAQTFFYNGYNTSEHQVGVLRTDGVFNNYRFKGSLTEGQPISYNGSTAIFSGQIGYLPFPAAIDIFGPVTVTSLIEDFGDLIFWALLMLFAFILVVIPKRKVNIPAIS